MPQAVRITEVAGSVAAVAAGAANYGTTLGVLTNSLPGLNAATQTLHSPNLINFPIVDASGNLINSNLRDGIHTKAQTIGGEFEIDLGGGFVINDKIRYANQSGRFVAPFTHAVNDANRYLSSTFGPGATAVFLNGPNAGAAVNSASLLSLTGNSLISEVALFDTEMNDMGNFVNDLRVTKSFETAGGDITATAGYFKMVQNFKQTWHWGRMLVSTQDDAAIINVPGFTEAGGLHL